MFVMFGHILAEANSRIRRISLGLPAIPSGVKHVRPFTYKDVKHDFSLGRSTAPHMKILVLILIDVNVFAELRPSSDSANQQQGRCAHVVCAGSVDHSRDDAHDSVGRRRCCRE